MLGPYFDDFQEIKLSIPSGKIKELMLNKAARLQEEAQSLRAIPKDHRYGMASEEFMPSPEFIDSMASEREAQIDVWKLAAECLPEENIECSLSTLLRFVAPSSASCVIPNPLPRTRRTGSIKS